MAKTEKSQQDQDLDSVLKLIRKEFGEESIMTFDNSYTQNIDSISTGSLQLDLALGTPNGGLPEGRINFIYGEPSSGKSTIALHLCAEAQKKGYLVAYLDVENALDLNYAKALGIDLERLLFSQPSSGTECFRIAEKLIDSGKVKLIIFDSISAMRSDAEINGEMGDNFIGKSAKMIGDGLKRISPLAAKNNCMCFFISQTRKNIGILYGDTDIMSGGSAPGFYASVIMKIWKKQSPITEKVNGEDIATSVETTVKVVKNKVAPPHRIARFIIRYGKGISQDEEVLDLSVKFGILERAGAWFRYSGQNIAQGREKALKWLKEDPARMQHFRQTIIEYIKNKKFELNDIVDESEENFDPVTGEIIED